MTEVLSPKRRRLQVRNRERDRDGNMRRNYGIGLVEYDALREAQDFRCAICGLHEDDVDPRANGGRPRHDGSEPLACRLCIDHCHATGTVRGLLCPNCNHGLGKFKDDPTRLRRAALYLDALEDSPAYGLSRLLAEDGGEGA